MRLAKDTHSSASCFGCACGRTNALGQLLLRVLPQCHSAGQRPVNFPGSVGCYTFLRRLGSGLRNKCGDFAVAGAADANTWCEAGIGLLIRLVVRDVQGVTAIDEYSARPPEL